MTEIMSVAIEDSKYREAVILNEYNGSYSLVSGQIGKDGKTYSRWAFPQNKDRKPNEKAIPVSVNLGDRYVAIDILKKMVAELEGSHAGESEQGEKSDDIPF